MKQIKLIIIVAGVWKEQIANLRKKKKENGNKGNILQIWGWDLRREKKKKKWERERAYVFWTLEHAIENWTRAVLIVPQGEMARLWEKGWAGPMCPGSGSACDPGWASSQPSVSWAVGGPQWDWRSPAEPSILPTQSQGGRKLKCESDSLWPSWL